MGFFLKWKTPSQRQRSGVILAVAFVIVCFMVYMLVPPFQSFFDRLMNGTRGLVWMAGGILVFSVWFLLTGQRGRSLFLAVAISAAVFLAAWVAVNFNTVWQSMVSVIGFWPTAILVMLAALVFLVVVKIVCY